MVSFFVCLMRSKWTKSQNHSCLAVFHPSYWASWLKMTTGHRWERRSSSRRHDGTRRHNGQTQFIMEPLPGTTLLSVLGGARGVETRECHYGLPLFRGSMTHHDTWLTKKNQNKMKTWIYACFGPLALIQLWIIYWTIFNLFIMDDMWNGVTSGERIPQKLACGISLRPYRKNRFFIV